MSNNLIRFSTVNIMQLFLVNSLAVVTASYCLVMLRLKFKFVHLMILDKFFCIKIV